MGLINLKTDLKSLKYGYDRPGGGSSNQPYIVTPIPDGYTSNGPDFLLRQGSLRASITDVERLTKFFADTTSVRGLLFTAKQELLERQNPKMVNTNRIYLPTNTINQAGALAVGTHFNKQGLDPINPLSYFVGGTDGYYFATRGIGEYPTFQTLSNGDIENRLTIAYTSKILNQPLGSLTINPFGITNLNPNILLSYNGGPNAPLGLGVTNIRIQNPTIKLKDVYKFGEDQAKAISENPNTTIALDNQNYVSHKEPVYLYNPEFTYDQISSRYGASYTYFKLAKGIEGEEPLNSNLFFPDPLTRDNITIYNKPLGKTKIAINYISTDPSKPGYLTPQRAVGGIAPTNNYNVSQIMSVGATQAYLDVYKDKGLGEGTGFRLIDTEPKEIIERNSATKPIDYPEYREDISTPSYINWVYNPSSGVNASKDYIDALGVGSLPNVSSSFFPDGLLNKETSTGIAGYTQNQKDANNANNIYAFNSEQLKNKNFPSDESNSSIGLIPSTDLNSLSDYRALINASVKQELGRNPLPETNYKEFNRERTYKTSNTKYRSLLFQSKEEGLITQTNPNESISQDVINSLDVVTSKEFELPYYTDADITKFFFEINDNDNKGNFFLFFRAYINNLSDGFQANWDSFKYVGRGENFYRYNGFTREMSIAFTIYAHSRAEMVPLYNKINYLAGTTTPNYSEAGYMRGNFTYITIGDYLNHVPCIIKSITLKPSFEAGWDINREENGVLINPNSDLSVGQIPRMIDVDLGFIPLHDFTPQFRKPFIRNIERIPFIEPYIPKVEHKKPKKRK